MKFCTLTQFDTLDPSDHYNFENLKIQDEGRRHFEKSQDPEMVSPITAKLGKVMHIVILTVLTVKTLKFYKSTMVAVAIPTKKLKRC